MLKRGRVCIKNNAKKKKITKSSKKKKNVCTGVKNYQEKKNTVMYQRTLYLNPLFMDSVSR